MDSSARSISATSTAFQSPAAKDAIMSTSAASSLSPAAQAQMNFPSPLMAATATTSSSDMPAAIASPAAATMTASTAGTATTGSAATPNPTALTAARATTPSSVTA